ncbi:hypothetical protein FHT28_003537 [Rhizobium sp. SG570]|nr:hypothetical protein [Rhizobium sp. SG570]
MRTIEKAEHILVDGRADFIAIGRPILERPPPPTGGNPANARCSSGFQPNTPVDNCPFAPGRSALRSQPVYFALD